MSAIESPSLPEASTSTAESEQDIYLAPPVCADLSDLVKNPNTPEGILALFEWWAELTGEQIDHAKLKPIFHDFGSILYNSGVALKTTDSPAEMALKKNSDCCVRALYVAEGPAKESLADFALRKGYYSNPAGGPHSELLTILEKVSRLHTCDQWFLCLDIHASLGLVKIYKEVDQTPSWLCEHLGLPENYLQIETILNQDPSKRTTVTVIGFDLINNTMNWYTTFENEDRKILVDILRKAIGLCGTEVQLPEDMTYMTQETFLDLVITYSFTTHQFIRVGSYCLYDFDAPNIDESGATPYIKHIFEKSKERLGSVGLTKNPIKGVLPFSKFIVGHTFSRGKKYYVKLEAMQELGIQFGWKFYKLIADKTNKSVSH